MGFFRNPEIRRALILYAGVTAAVTALGLFFGVGGGLFGLGVCLLFSGLYFYSTYLRYKKISRLSREITAVLHGQETLALSSFEEGELSILQSEIAKMTVRLREQAEKLREDKVFLADSIADISHQIKTPLTSINLVASMLSDSKLDYPRRLALMKELEQLLGRIDWLINALLKMSRLDAGMANLQQETVYLQELLKKASEPFLIPMELRNQQLLIQDPGQQQYCGDMAWSVEAVSNILKNCVEHTPEGGEIRIETTENPLFTQIIIADNGPGIDEGDLPHLFERFYRGKNASDTSVGIGLALARMIITGQNGTIKAENSRGGGAKFIGRFYKSTV